MSTSPTSGAFVIVLCPSPSIAATMCLVTAFFDPRTQMSPRSGPDGSTCHVSVTQTTVGALQRQPPEIHLAELNRTIPAPVTLAGGVCRWPPPDRSHRAEPALCRLAVFAGRREAR